MTEPGAYICFVQPLHTGSVKNYLMYLLPLLRTLPTLRDASLSLLWMSTVRFIEWDGSAEWSFLMPVWQCEHYHLFSLRGYHRLSLPTCSLTYQQGNEWCWWHLLYKHFICPPSQFWEGILGKIHSQLLRFRDEKWIASFPKKTVIKKKKVKQ